MGRLARIAGSFPLVATLVALGGSAAFARAPAWQVVVPAARVPQLIAVTAVSPTDVWAVGGYNPWGSAGEDDPAASPVIVHWNGKTLSRFAAFRPAIRPAALTSIAALSARDIWAVGYGRNYTFPVSHPVAMHWDGESWKRVRLPDAGGQAARKSVAAFASNDVWAVGYVTHVGDSALVMHWDGRSWRIVDIPPLVRRVSSLFEQPTAQRSCDEVPATAFNLGRANLEIRAGLRILPVPRRDRTPGQRRGVEHR